LAQAKSHPYLYANTMGLRFSRAARTKFHDKYALCGRVGCGTFAEVHLATSLQSVDTRRIAVKIVKQVDHVGGMASAKEMRSAVREEVKIWRRIGINDNCVRLHDVFFSSGVCYMVMERCDIDFLHYIETMLEFDERSLGVALSQMLSGLQHVHSRKVIHRDVKPDNFIAGGKNGKTLKLCDFGLSVSRSWWKRFDGATGTAPFMCPEMIEERTYDEKADVWSFGVIVYALLFGALPYYRMNRSSKAMMNAIARGRPAPKFTTVSQSLSKFQSTRSRDAVEFAKSLLIREPQERPSAFEAASMTYMNAVTENCHMLGAELPSLKPMIYKAKRSGLFACRKTRKVEADSEKRKKPKLQTCRATRSNSIKGNCPGLGKLFMPWHSKYVQV